jgi:hypothetical protein
MSSEAQIFLFSVIVIAHVIFLGNWAFYFLQEMRTTIRSKFPQAYLSLFLCCQRKKLEKELQIEDYREKMLPFINSID